MANAKQLAILRQGVGVWNQWRKEHQHIEINLSRANLIGANLTNINLQRAYLFGTDLSGATLYEADLFGAIFHQANLAGAKLQGANLYMTDFKQANLEGADLSQTKLQWAVLWGTNLAGADLFEAHIHGANLFEANLQDARIHGTVFAEMDLRTVQGLDTIQYSGPSTIGIDTLYRSQGDIPEVFLRGCGVPDSMIEYAHSLVAAERPIDYYSVFISYSSHDEAIAQRLHADLQARGVRCWFAPHDLEIGEVITRGIDEAIRIYDKLLIILSEAAVTSRWVEFEVNQALYRELDQGRTMLFPIRLDDTVLHTRSGWAMQLRTRNIGDFRSWKDHDRYQEAFARLLRDLKAKDQAGE